MLSSSAIEPTAIILFALFFTRTVPSEVQQSTNILALFRHLAFHNRLALFLVRSSFTYMGVSGSSDIPVGFKFTVAIDSLSISISGKFY